MRSRSFIRIGSILGVLLLLAGCTGLESLDDIHELSYPEKRSSSAITITSDGSIVLAANPDSNTISLIDAADLELVGEIQVGVDPRTVSTDLRGEIAAVANRSSGSVSLVDLAAALGVGKSNRAVVRAHRAEQIGACPPLADVQVVGLAAR